MDEDKKPIRAYTRSLSGSTTPDVATPLTGHSRIIALILWFFAGGIGAHNYYMGRSKIGLVQTLLAVIGPLLSVLMMFCSNDNTFWLIAGVSLFYGTAITIFIWVVVDLIYILTVKDDHFTWSFN